MEAHCPTVLFFGSTFPLGQQVDELGLEETCPCGFCVHVFSFFFFQGNEGKGVTNIMLTHLPRQAQGWSVPQPVIDGTHPVFQSALQTHPHHNRAKYSTFVSLQNPVLFADPEVYMVNNVRITKLHLYFTSQVIDAGQGTSKVCAQ